MPCNTTTPASGEPTVFDQLGDLDNRLEQLRAQAGMIESIALLDHVSEHNNIVQLLRDDVSEFFSIWRLALEDARALIETIHKRVHAAFAAKGQA